MTHAACSLLLSNTKHLDAILCGLYSKDAGPLDLTALLQMDDSAKDWSPLRSPLEPLVCSKADMTSDMTILLEVCSDLVTFVSIPIILPTPDSHFALTLTIARSSEALQRCACAESPSQMRIGGGM